MRCPTRLTCDSIHTCGRPFILRLFAKRTFPHHRSFGVHCATCPLSAAAELVRFGRTQTVLAFTRECPALLVDEACSFIEVKLEQPVAFAVRRGALRVAPLPSGQPGPALQRADVTDAAVGHRSTLLEIYGFLKTARGVTARRIAPEGARFPCR